MADPPNPSDSGALAADWITIWQSEWAAAAVDREVREAWMRAAAQAGASLPQAPGDPASGPARPVPAARASTAADAPDARGAGGASLRDAAIADLRDRVAALERRAANAADPTCR